MKTKVYYDPIKELHNVFKTHAVAVRINMDEWYQDAKFYEPSFKFTTNTYYAFVLRKIYKIWEDLPMNCGGPREFDIYEETTLLPQGLETASVRLRKYISEIDASEKEDILCWHTEDEEYRIIVDNYELKNNLSELADFIYESSKEENKSVEFWL
ncbi:MAG: hypothetical protein HYZ42_15220 [Bacteroidetes bacterium]|nr:hypothetical protein [Bacteroidota bacterium]